MCEFSSGYHSSHAILSRQRESHQLASEAFKLGKVRLVSDGDKNKVQASKVDGDKNKEQASNRFGCYLAALSARSPFWLVSGDHLNHQLLTDIIIKSKH